MEEPDASVKIPSKAPNMNLRAISNATLTVTPTSDVSEITSQSGGSGVVNGANRYTVQWTNPDGSVDIDDGSKVSKPKVLAQIAQTVAVISKRRPFWKDRNISLRTMMRQMRLLVI